VPNSPRIDQFKRLTARRLRQNATGAEDGLRRYLKRLEVRGTHFRRQMPIGNFIVDFACPAARLVIEVDGSQHAEAGKFANDIARTQWLQSQGYRVLRFWNNDVSQNIRGVLETIYAALYGSPDAEARPLKHERRVRSAAHPTPRAFGARPSPSRGG